METPLAYLQQRATDEWLIGKDSHQFNQLATQLYTELIQRLQGETPPKILLAEREPIKLLAGFIAACAAGCPVFLGNPNWVKSEWQQVFELVQPDLTLGQGDWELTVKDYYPSAQPAILNPAWIMLPTGGSSGKIRFAIHTWETLMASVQGFQQYFQLQQVNSVCVLPLYHVSGLMQFLRCFTTGGKLVILPFKTLEADGIAKINLTSFFISLVPTQLQRLLQQPASSKWLSQFQTVLLGGAPAWEQLLAQARQYNIRLALTYGMTETASQIATLKPEEFLSGKSNCGQVLPHAKITIHNSAGAILTANQVGNLKIQAKSLALGYYPEYFTDTEQFSVDDIGFLDDRGYLNVVGRDSNKIITGGENVFPNEVEAAIRATQLVNDVCVIGLPDQKWGQVVTAVYVPSSSLVCTETIRVAIADKLSKFKQPKYWLAVQILPRNLQGKINREQLLKIAIASLPISSS